MEVRLDEGEGTFFFTEHNDDTKPGINEVNETYKLKHMNMKWKLI